jgi:hypothetical protein
MDGSYASQLSVAEVQGSRSLLLPAFQGSYVSGQLSVA